MTLNTQTGRRASLLTGAAVLAICSTAFAGTAQAKPFTLNAGAKATKGKAHAKGSVTFPAPKKVKVSGTVDDQCPKDGYGAYIEFKVNFVGGGYGTIVKRDTRGCESGATSFAFSQSFPRVVKSVGVTLMEIDADTSKVGDFARKLITR